MIMNINPILHIATITLRFHFIKIHTCIAKSCDTRFLQTLFFGYSFFFSLTEHGCMLLDFFFFDFFTGKNALQGSARMHRRRGMFFLFLFLEQMLHGM